MALEQGGGECSWVVEKAVGESRGDEEEDDDDDDGPEREDAMERVWTRGE